MTALLGQQWRERRPDLVRADLRLAGRFIDVDEQPLEEGQVKGLVEILRHRLQQPPRILQQLQQHRDRLASALHLGITDFGQALIDHRRLITQPPHRRLGFIWDAGNTEIPVEPGEIRSRLWSFTTTGR
ncbi:hypothetical protein L0U85_15910 [Glycomyces sp. L485]|uniref:hypothetical protein n=1 Tax=Glycomyces sp. L485 TaxID=2909235 RepID=UPI001F4B2D18|nr:hypothetical protein [Glycomyces sp. L485]MCH7232329.1 hypothetical protein [Glycomyces sp. L485]